MQDVLLRSILFTLYYIVERIIHVLVGKIGYGVKEIKHKTCFTSTKYAQTCKSRVNLLSR